MSKKDKTAKIIDGKAVAAEIRAEVAIEVSQRIKSIKIELDSGASEQDLLDEIDKLNRDVSVHGILVQLPLPHHMDEERVIERIDPENDVDGFHPENVGKLSIGIDCLAPCTPSGIPELITRSGIDMSGKHAVIIGRSNIVGKPLMSILVQKGKKANCTVTCCHSGTDHLANFTRQADILIAAIGVPEFVTHGMVKPGATVIDVGINRVDDLEHSRGYRLVGDVNFDDVKEVAGAITPVPGGVGPMTVAMLMKNTAKAARMIHRI
ncbi:UNVERIFIED_CONTAM: hypothetical protein GTU68_007862 [Idotea baltica]|nr:hypothetical protein [Idotea baltica]